MQRCKNAMNGTPGQGSSIGECPLPAVSAQMKARITLSLLPCLELATKAPDIETVRMYSMVVDGGAVLGVKVSSATLNPTGG